MVSESFIGHPNCIILSLSLDLFLRCYFHIFEFNKNENVSFFQVFASATCEIASC